MTAQELAALLKPIEGLCTSRQAGGAGIVKAVRATAHPSYDFVPQIVLIDFYGDPREPPNVMIPEPYTRLLRADRDLGSEVLVLWFARTDGRTPMLQVEGPAEAITRLAEQMQAQIPEEVMI